jgi:pSer/pThr/pTyr-binding forkhead associated (FHA) protein
VSGSTPALTLAPLRQALAGACGGMIAFLFLEPGSRARELAGEGDDLLTGVVFLGMVFGGVVAAILAAADEAPSGRVFRMATRGLLAGLLGALIGLAASIVANLVYAILRIFTFFGGGLGFQILARTAGWALFGAGVGLAAGLLSRAQSRVVQGGLGGLLGGAVGGFLFDLITIATHSQTATLSRLIGFTAVAACVGFATALVEELSRVAWLVFLTGSREGRQVILHRDVVLGRDELVDVPLFGDPSVGKRQAEITLHPHPQITEVGETPLLRVDGVPVRSAALADGMTVEIGRHRLRFHHRYETQVSAASPVPLSPSPMQDRGAVAPSPPSPAPTWLGEEPPPGAWTGAPAAPPPGWPAPVTTEGGCGPVLRIVAGPNAGSVVSLDYDPCTIGRGLDNTLPLADPRVSRYHARIVFLEGEEAWFLEDLGSTNGTFLNGLRISRAGLAPGDLIQMGDTRISVEAPVLAADTPNDRTMLA